MVLGRLKRHDRLPVGNRQHAGLLAVEPLLDHQPVAGGAEDLLPGDLLDGARASSRSEQTTTPLPAASPSALTTIGTSSRSLRNLIASSGLRNAGSRPWARRRGGAGPCRRPCWPRARRRRGAARTPAVPASSKASTMPAARGSPARPRSARLRSPGRSGSSREIVGWMATFSPSISVPALPGATKTRSARGLWPIFHAKACSRPRCRQLEIFIRKRLPESRHKTTIVVRPGAGAGVWLPCRWSRVPTICYDSAMSRTTNPSPRRDSSGGQAGFRRRAGGAGRAASAWTAAVARFFGPDRSTGDSLAGGTRFAAGFPTEYADGRVETKYRETYGVWIVREAFGSRSRICALRSTCTHLGCMTVWREGEQRFRCPCHGSAFIESGSVWRGPPVVRWNAAQFGWRKTVESKLTPLGRSAKIWAVDRCGEFLEV